MLRSAAHMPAGPSLPENVRKTSTEEEPEDDLATVSEDHDAPSEARRLPRPSGLRFTKVSSEHRRGLLARRVESARGLFTRRSERIGEQARGASPPPREHAAQLPPAAPEPGCFSAAVSAADETAFARPEDTVERHLQARRSMKESEEALERIMGCRTTGRSGNKEGPGRSVSRRESSSSRRREPEATPQAARVCAQASSLSRPDASSLPRPDARRPLSGGGRLAAACDPLCC
jgi:hypothetical protein